MNSNGTSYQNGLFVNVDEEHNNTKNMTLSGFNQVGGKVTGNIQNLTIESKQNTSTTTGSTKGGSIGFAPNGMPTSISANYSQTNGERKYVDDPTTFIIGEGSNLKVGKVENTAAAIGTSGNGKLSIDEYVGHNLENKDKTTTKGGSVSLSQSSIPISGVGVNYANRDLESVTKNTVVGNVSIGKSSGDEINKDLDTMTEVTKDEDTKTNVFVESQTIRYAVNPESFKEDLQKAKNEIHDIYHAVDSTVNPQGKESRNVLQQLAETRQAKTIYNVIDSRLQIAENQEDIAKAFEGVSEDLGYKVKVIYTDPSNSPQLIGVDENGNEYIKNGTAYVDKKTGIGYILVNTKSPVNSTKAGVIGTLAEEQSHVIGKFEGRQKVVPDGSEKGLESLGKPTNDYFKNQYSKNDKAIGLKSDGRDYSNVDFGEHVGDDIFDDLAHKESLNFTLRDGASRLTNNSLKVIEEKGIEYALEKGLVKYEPTIHKKFAEEKAVKKEIDEKQKIAIQKSKEDPLYNYYLAVDGVSRKVTIEKELKPNSFGKNLKDSTSKALKEGYDSVINSVPNYDKWQKMSKEYGEMESSLTGSVLLQAVGNLITVPGRMATEMNLFGPGEIQYGSVKDIRERQQKLNDVIRGKADLLTTIVAYSAVESIKDSKTFQKVKNKVFPNEIPDITIEDGVSNVVNSQNKDLSKEYQSLINYEKQQELERIKKSTNEIIKAQASAKAEVLDKFTPEELSKFKKNLGSANLALDEKTGAVIGPKGGTGEIIGKTSNGDKVIKMYGNQYYKITEKGKVKIAAEDVIKFKNPVTDTDGNNLIFGGIKKIEDTPTKKGMFESTKNKIDGIASALTGKSKTQRQLESLGIKSEVKDIGLKVDGTTKTGLDIDEALENSLGRTFKTYDQYDETTKTATSVKSVDITSKTYTSGSGLSSKLNGDLKAIKDFTEYELDKVRLENKDIEVRVLKIVINNEPLNKSQIENLKKVVDHATEDGIKVEAVILK